MTVTALCGIQCSVIAWYALHHVPSSLRVVSARAAQKTSTFEKTFAKFNELCSRTRYKGTQL